MVNGCFEVGVVGVDGCEDLLDCEKRGVRDVGDFNDRLRMSGGVVDFKLMLKFIKIVYYLCWIKIVM